MTTTSNQLSISIPNDWTPPKYHLGQWVKQGLIIGCTYYQGGTKPPYQYQTTWRYCVLPDERSEEEDYFQESEIKPLTPEELQAKIQSEIDFHHGRIAALSKQLLFTGEQHHD